MSRLLSGLPNLPRKHPTIQTQPLMPTVLSGDSSSKKKPSTAPLFFPLLLQLLGVFPPLLSIFIHYLPDGASTFSPKRHCIRFWYLIKPGVISLDRLTVWARWSRGTKMNHLPEFTSTDKHEPMAFRARQLFYGTRWIARHKNLSYIFQQPLVSCWLVVSC